MEPKDVDGVQLEVDLGVMEGMSAVSMLSREEVMRRKLTTGGLNGRWYFLWKHTLFVDMEK